MLPVKSQHEFRPDEMYRQKDRTSFLSFNSIHLDYCGIGCFFHFPEESLPVPAFPAGPVDFERPFLYPLSIPHFPWKIDIAEGKEAIIDHPVKGPLADHDLVLVVDADMVDRLFLSDKRRHDFFDPGDVIFRRRDAGAAFREMFPVIRMSDLRSVELFFKGTVRSDRTAITYIGCLQEFPAYFFFKPVTERVAQAAVSAEPDFSQGMADVADRESFPGTSEAMPAGIVPDPAGTGLFGDGMLPYLKGNGGRMFVQGLCDLGKSKVFRQHPGNLHPLIKSEMFVVCHVAPPIYRDMSI